MGSRALVLAGALLAESAASAAEVAGIAFEEKIRVDAEELVLNGAGRKRVQKA